MIGTMRAASGGGTRGLAAACGGLTLLACLSVVYATPRDAYWVVDCGNKALVARRLLESGFREARFDYPAARLDPGGRAFPIPPPFALHQGDGFVSQYPLAYPLLAAPFLGALGPAGLRWPAALGVAACAALFVLWTVPALGRGWAVFGGLTLGLTTPLFFYGTVVWEHSITVALPLASVLLLGRSTLPRAATAGALAAAACLLRAELALMGLALAGALALRSRRLLPVAALAAGALPFAVAALAIDAWLYGNPLGVHVTANVGPDAALRAGGVAVVLRRLGALLAGGGWGPAEGLAVALVACACLGAGALAARRGRAPSGVLLALAAAGVGACLYALSRIATARIALLSLAHYNGLLMQLPWLAVAGLGGVLCFRDARYAALRLGVTAGLGFLVLAIPFRVTLTPFETGSFFGPRMLLPGLPALLALALVALHAGGRPGRIAAAVLALAGLLASGLAVQLLDRQKREVERLQQVVTSAPERVVVTNHPALGQQLAAIWGAKPFLYAADDAELARLARRLGASGVDAYLLVFRPRSGRPPVSGGDAVCRRRAEHRGRHVALLFDFDLYTCRPRRAARPPVP